LEHATGPKPVFEEAAVVESQAFEELQQNEAGEVVDEEDVLSGLLTVRGGGRR
jgi:hypothetical protein